MRSRAAAANPTSTRSTAPPRSSPATWPPCSSGHAHHDPRRRPHRAPGRCSPLAIARRSYCHISEGCPVLVDMRIAIVGGTGTVGRGGGARAGRARARGAGALAPCAGVPGRPARRRGAGARAGRRRGRHRRLRRAVARVLVDGTRRLLAGRGATPASRHHVGGLDHRHRPRRRAVLQAQARPGGRRSARAASRGRSCARPSSTRWSRGVRHERAAAGSCRPSARRCSPSIRPRSAARWRDTAETEPSLAIAAVRGARGGRARRARAALARGDGLARRARPAARAPRSLRERRADNPRRVARQPVPSTSWLAS